MQPAYASPTAGSAVDTPPPHDASPQRAAAAIAHRRARTLALGPCMRLQFEDHETIRHQVETILRAERLGHDPLAARHERAAYAHLLPDGTSWNATLFIELPDAAERARELPQLNEAVHELGLAWPGHVRVMACANADLPDRHRQRPSAVHFLRFAFTAAQRAALRQLAAADSPTLVCTHPAYPFAARIAPPLLVHLQRDLAPAAWT
ncbi:MAG TPA: DUF3501 family protein [Burkholderiaceae bacterium]|nr:DUF3501 family protein [Burkholderiaceae bacterium]